ncbi:PAS domain S-box protein [Cohnella rhizosphaerae]|uniref:PAS domain S-box protein n=1 Tax=Cohnella rhizosphaerae TaxID=1457232 RepID=A0A9X4KR92_9BACL|nr:PAS domain S-box protein [Cohnella rhizosphaerae]MDG0809342.1 PAS domain S-box protein [Cohnella rhizosphaerae]
MSGFLASAGNMKHDKTLWTLYARIYRDSQEAIMITDRHARIIQVNPSFSRITGYDEGEVVGLTPSVLKSDCQPPEFYARMWAAIHLEGKWKGEIWNRRKNGEVYPQWLSISAVKDEAGQLQNYMAMFLDLTEYKNAASKLRLHAQVFSHAGEGIMITDAGLRILSVNKAFTAVTGYTEEEACGHTPALLRSGRHGRDFYDRMWASLRGTGRWQGGDLEPTEGWRTVSRVPLHHDAARRAWRGHELHWHVQGHHRAQAVGGQAEVSRPLRFVDRTAQPDAAAGDAPGRHGGLPQKGRAAGRAVHRPGPVQVRQRFARPRRGRQGAAADGRTPEAGRPRGRRRIEARRRRIHRRPAAPEACGRSDGNVAADRGANGASVRRGGQRDLHDGQHRHQPVPGSRQGSGIAHAACGPGHVRGQVARHGAAGVQRGDQRRFFCASFGWSGSFGSRPNAGSSGSSTSRRSGWRAACWRAWSRCSDGGIPSWARSRLQSSSRSRRRRD